MTRTRRQRWHWIRSNLLYPLSWPIRVLLGDPRNEVEF